jgi:predicted esterase
MGGYGVCRIFYEHPAKFKALAIFSGQPDLANEWLEGEQINFLEERNINILKDIPIFIFHGKEDKNVPFEKAVEFVNKLKKINTNYLFYSENTGHDAPPKDIMEKYYNWLDDVIK